MSSDLSFNPMEHYVADSNECVHFKLVTCPEDLEEDFENGHTNTDHKHSAKIVNFSPDMSYQFFGENENIFGYKNLSVNIFYSCARLNIYVGMKYAGKVSKDQTGGIEADEVIPKISSKYETKIYFNLAEFSSSLSKESTFVPYGESIKEFSIECPSEEGQPKKRHFQIFKAHSSNPGFGAYHERLQTFLMWFIEAASYIDFDDERWDFLVMYEKLPLDPNSSTENVPIEFQYCFIGYSTLYRYFAYPDNMRPRISQFLILPPFQRMKLGTKLLETIYSHYNNKSTFDITVEDPSDDFQRMRDITDCKLCSTLDAFSDHQIRNGWSKEMAKDAQDKFKIASKQARRVYEILRLKITNRSNTSDYQTYRLDIKQRLNAPYQKQIVDLEKLRSKKIISESNYTTLMKSTKLPNDYRIKTLSKQYEEIESDYLEIIEKLN